uniref:Poly(A) RNA polymerase mitochondrial-like central palm domain-containing protein n=1 Tax=Ananas comosus var. bracteatus TaxID=296719 RepID=A0A6V7QDC8_ANACO|nr:unnamed protein product [Ananas comosus var. bracteatus]
MTLNTAALCKRAKKRELKESKKISLNPALVSSLDGVLIDVYGNLRPRPVDYEHRRTLVRVFNIMATEIFGNSNGFPIVDAFGSFTMDLFTATSDLDLSVNFSDDTTTNFARENKISTLRKLAKRLGGIVFGVLPVLHARVPVLKVRDRGTGVECDISVENKDGITRSRIFSLVSSIDERFRILSYLMKTWAKAHDINSPKDRTVSSMSIISLVAFHLQTRNPPILPPFSAFLKDGTNIASIESNIVQLKQFGRENKESIAELFITLITKLSSIDSLWEHGLCASTYEGSWISKSWNSGGGNMSVEDFLDRSQNFARSVGKAEMKIICKCIQTSFINLSRFMSGRINSSKLMELLFGFLPQSIPTSPPVQRSLENKTKRHIDPSDSPRNPAPTKRARQTAHTNPNRLPSYQTQSRLPRSNVVRPPLIDQPINIVNPLQLQYFPHPVLVPSPHLGYIPQHPQFQFAPLLGHRPQEPLLPNSFLMIHGSQEHWYDHSSMVPRIWGEGRYQPFRR